MKNYLLSLMLLAALCAGCTDDNEPTQPARSLKDAPIRITVSDAGSQTRAGYDPANLPEKFYLTIDQEGEEYDYNVVMKRAADGTWKSYASEAEEAAEVQMLWAGSGSADITAATFALAGGEPYALSVAEDQTDATAVAASDHLYYSGNQAPSDEGIHVTFGHQMSKVSLTITLGEEYAGQSDPISSVLVCGVPNDIMPCKTGYDSNTRTATYEVILVPQTVEAGTFVVEIHAGGKDYQWTSTAAVSLTSGNLYTLDLTNGVYQEVQMPYVTFASASEQNFKMDFKHYPSFSEFKLGDDEYFEYSVGGGEWTRFTTTTGKILFGGPDKDLRLRGLSSRGTGQEGGCINISFTGAEGSVACSGDIRTLVDYRRYKTVSTAGARFAYLFEGCTQLTSAPDLPATTLASGCYIRMFYGCTQLISAPSQLPATKLAANCYFEMFTGCSALTSVADDFLPATELAVYCYGNMFVYCTSLENAPKLPATTLAPNCYASMFNGCSSLVTAPELKAETFAAYCYDSMFCDCSSLTSVTMLGHLFPDGLSEHDCLGDWLYNAGSSAPSRTLKVYDKDALQTIKVVTDQSWWYSHYNPTVLDKDGNRIDTNDL